MPKTSLKQPLIKLTPETNCLTILSEKVVSYLLIVKRDEHNNNLETWKLDKKEKSLQILHKTQLQYQRAYHLKIYWL